MSSDSSVEVTGLSPSTSDSALESFFSFCGRISKVTRDEKKATVVFEKASAAKTSLMLDGGTLDGFTIHVTSPHAATAGASPVATSPVVAQAVGDEVSQEDKPRSAIVAEYLAHGYVLGDATISKAIALDEKHGISAKFLNFFGQLDDKYAVQQKTNAATGQISAKANEVGAQLKSHGGNLDAQTGASTKLADLDAKTGASKHLSNAWEVGRSYYSKALASPHGTKVRDFYTRTAKQVHDVHAEAHRLAEEKAGHPITGFTSRRSSVVDPGTAATGVGNATVDPTGAAVPVATETPPVSTAPGVSTTPAPTGAVQ